MIVDPRANGDRSAAEARVTSLRDELLRLAALLEHTPSISIPEFEAMVRRACAIVQDGDLGPDGVTVGLQFEAMLARLADLAVEHPDPVPTTTLGLPADARFLNDMAEFLTLRYALDAAD
jgi:hypothetical protein